MTPRGRFLFLALVLTQAAHALEEYAFRLYDVFEPARLVSGLASGLFGADLETGFLIVNAALVGFGFWCYVARVRTGRRSARGLAWFWVVLELGNGVGHPLVSLSRGAYVPGVVTAVPLMVLAVALGDQLIRSAEARA